VPKIIKIGGNLTKLWQKQFCSFLDTMYRRLVDQRTAKNCNLQVNN